MRPFIVIVAATAGSMGIGRQGKLPWHLPADMEHFRSLTCTTTKPNCINAVIMGRKTWQSLPAKFRPLKNRLNVVLSRNPAVREEFDIPLTVRVAGGLQEALSQLAKGEDADKVEKVYIIGGAKLYEEALSSNYCQTVELTTIYSDVPDTFELKSSSEVQEHKGIRFAFHTYERKEKVEASSTSQVQSTVATTRGGGAKDEREGGGEEAQPNEEEMQYLRLVEEIMDKGVHRGDRTNTGTLSKFGAQLRFSLRDEVFPLLTTKKVFWRGVAEELLWFVSGCTNAKKLQQKNIHIWDGNGSREYLDKLGFTNREEGDLGPVYGFQWRHFGAKYLDMHTDYTGQGIDQLAKVIHTIKANPEDRRIIMSAWNPLDLDKMALPPCHTFCQFYVANGELSCQMYQRSADMGLGVPFNIASYALLTRLIAQVCDLRPGDFVHTIGDAHVYTNHCEALREQLKRKPRPFPRLHINPAKKDIDSFVFEDFRIDGYDPYETIKMKMAV